MSTNTIGGVNLARIAQRSLDSLVTELVPLKGIFVTDFSDEVAKGPSVTTRYPTNPTVKQLLTAANRVSDNSTINSVQVNIGNPRGVDIGFNDVEVINSEIQLEQLFIRPGVTAIIEDIMATIFALVTSGNFAQNQIAASAAYDADMVSTISQAMSVAKIPKNPRSAIVAPAYYGNLQRDGSIQQSYAYGGAEAIRNNMATRVHGIDQYEYNGTIPTNGENLTGFACGPAAICLAARRPVDPQDWYGQVENTIEPVTGLPVQFRHFYDGAEHRLQMLTQHGAAVGVAANLIRIKSA